METQFFHDLKKSFSFSVPTQIIFGVGCTTNIHELVKKMNIKKPLVVTDPGIINSGLLKEIISRLENNKILYELFDQVEINPSVQTVVKGANKYQTGFCDGLIAMGGGSVIDAAKAIGILVTHSQPLNEFEGKDLLKYDIPPLLAVPTTAGTGAEVSFEAVIIDKILNYKLTINSIKLAPKIALLDPVLLGTLPERIAAATGIDTLTRAIEGFVSKEATLITDLLNIEAIRLVGSSLRQFVADPSNIDFGAKMQLACVLTTIGSINSGNGNVSFMAKPLESYLNIHHGIACGVMLPHIMQWNLIANPDKYALIAEKLGEDVNGHSVMDKASKAVSSVQKLVLDVGLPTTLTEIGLKYDIIEKMANDAFNSLDSNGNPRRTSLEDIVELYNKAL